MFFKTFTAAAMGIALAATTLPAAANGQLSFGISGANQQERDLIAGGLLLYQIAQGVESGAFVHQDGSLNAAGLQQLGTGSNGVIHQEGNGHQGTLAQQGNGQSGGVFQFGNNTNANLTQTSHGAADLLFVFGW